MKRLIAVLSACLTAVLICFGCVQHRVTTNPIVERITPHLIQLRDNPSQEQMFTVIGECEKVREARGHKVVADTLKQIAENNPDVRKQALSLLTRYVSVGEYGDFVTELSKKE